jgi:hypothetical protein
MKPPLLAVRVSNNSNKNMISTTVRIPQKQKIEDFLRQAVNWIRTSIVF